MGERREAEARGAEAAPLTSITAAAARLSLHSVVQSSRRPRHSCPTMNIFRLTGDLSHLLAVIILLVKIWKTRSCAGE